MKSYKHIFHFALPLVAGARPYRLLASNCQRRASAANVAGTWMIYTHGDDGKTGTHTVQIVQNGNTLTGHFKGPYPIGRNRRHDELPPHTVSAPRRGTCSPSVEWSTETPWKETLASAGTTEPGKEDAQTDCRHKERKEPVTCRIN